MLAKTNRPQPLKIHHFLQFPQNNLQESLQIALLADSKSQIPIPSFSKKNHRKLPTPGLLRWLPKAEYEAKKREEEMMRSSAVGIRGFFFILGTGDTPWMMSR